MQSIKNAFFVLLDNLDYVGILLLLFVAIGALCYAVMVLLLGGQSETQTHLARLLGIRGKTGEEGVRPRFLNQDKSDTLAARVSRPLHRLATLNDRSLRNRLRLQLIQAGYRSDKAFYNYLAAKIALPILLIVIYLMSRSFYNIAFDILLGIIAMCIIGFFAPNLWLMLMRMDRQQRIFKGLPDALDLMVVCVESGLGLDMTFKRVGDEIRSLSKDLADEFSLTTLEVRAGKSRDEAFRNMSLRCNVPEVSNLMTVLSQTSRFGTSMATALRVHADAMRIKRRQYAEEKAAKSTVKIVFPLILFIFPAIFVVLIGPGAIRIIKNLFPALGG
jgi:tight adherence protein C